MGGVLATSSWSVVVGGGCRTDGFVGKAPINASIILIVVGVMMAELGTALLTLALTRRPAGMKADTVRSIMMVRGRLRLHSSTTRGASLMQ